MGKPEKNRAGRPLESDEPKSANITFTTTPERKLRYQGLAKATGQSLAKEIEERLRRSIERDEQMGGPTEARLLDEIGLVLRSISETRGKPWQSEFAGLQMAKGAVGAILDRHAAPSVEKEFQPINEAIDQRDRAWEAQKETKRLLDDAIGHREEVALKGLFGSIGTQKLYDGGFTKEQALRLAEIFPEHSELIMQHSRNLANWEEAYRRSEQLQNELQNRLLNIGPLARLGLFKTFDELPKDQD